MRDYSDDPDIPDPEIGIWGWGTDCTCLPEAPKRDVAQEQRAKYWKDKADRQRKTSYGFNRHMIDLYNASNP